MLQTASDISTLSDKIRSRTARVGIVGLGYVGLPLAVEFAKAGFRVTGIDVARKQDSTRQRRRFLRRRHPQRAIWRRWSSPASSAPPPIFPWCSELDTINICVPTPLRKTKDPDMSFIVSACQEIARIFPSRHAGDSGIHHLSRHDR